MKLKFNKSQTPLILAFALPLVMIAVVALSIYIPRLFIHPHYDFIFSIGPYYENSYTYSVVGNHLSRSEYRINAQPNPQGHLYRYSAATSSSSEISFGEAQTYLLSDALLSPDGFEVTTGSSESFGLFPLFVSSGRDYNARYLKKGSIVTKINLPEYSYNNQFQFIGWIQ